MVETEEDEPNTKQEAPRIPDYFSKDPRLSRYPRKQKPGTGAPSQITELIPHSPTPPF